MRLKCNSLLIDVNNNENNNEVIVGTKYGRIIKYE